MLLKLAKGSKLWSCPEIFILGSRTWPCLETVICFVKEMVVMAESCQSRAVLGHFGRRSIVFLIHVRIWHSILWPHSKSMLSRVDTLFISTINKEFDTKPFIIWWSSFHIEATKLTWFQRNFILSPVEYPCDQISHLAGCPWCYISFGPRGMGKWGALVT